MGRLAKAVNLAPHQVNIGKTIVGPVDLEVHKGKDGRIYVRHGSLVPHTASMLTCPQPCVSTPPPSGP